MGNRVDRSLGASRSRLLVVLACCALHGAILAEEKQSGAGSNWPASEPRRFYNWRQIPHDDEPISLSDQPQDALDTQPIDCSPSAGNSSGQHHVDSAQQLDSTKVERATSGSQNGKQHEAHNTLCRLPATHKLSVRSRDLPHEEYKRFLTQLQPGDNVDKVLFDGKEPSWMDACNMKPRVNETARKLWKTFKRALGAQEIKNVQLKYGHHKSELRPDKAANELRARLKRSAALFKPDQQHLLQPAKSAGSGNSILFRELDKKRQQEKWWKPKKTTFAFSSAKSHYNKRPAWSKDRFIVSEPNGPAPGLVTDEAPANQAPKTPPQMVDSETGLEKGSAILRLVQDLDHLDVSMSLLFRQAHETVGQLRRNIRRALDEIQEDKEYKQAEEVSEQRRREIIEQRKWMPDFETMVIGEPVDTNQLYNFSSGLYHPEAQQFMRNMTQYIELFAIGVEQMMFDSWFFHKDQNATTSDEHYKTVETDTHLVLCEAKDLLNLLSEWHQSRKKFYQLFNREKPEVAKPAGIFAKLINNKLIRDRPMSDGFQHFESILDRAWNSLNTDQQKDKLKQFEMWLPENAPRGDMRRSASEPKPRSVNITRLTYPTHLWRDIMPPEQRQLYTLKERAIRDISIFREMLLFLRSYEALLSNSYPKI